MKPTILLVDDHEIVRKGIRRLLEGPTRDICGEAGSGEEAIQKAAQLKPDMILTDYHMPGIRGPGLVSRLREGLPKSRIIILTIDDSIVEEATMAGADACIYKGDVVAILNQTISRVLIGRQLADDGSNPSSLKQVFARESVAECIRGNTFEGETRA